MSPDTMLIEILAWCSDHPDEVEKRALPERQLRDMSTRGRALHEKQIKWIRDIHEKLFDSVHYENAWSSGKVPRGEALTTPTPAILKKPLPLKPPGRK